MRGLAWIVAFGVLASGCGDDDAPPRDAGAGDAAPQDAGPDPMSCASGAIVPPCTREPRGTVRWEPVDPQVFVGPFGTAASMFAEAAMFENTWLMPNHHYDSTLHIAAPTTAHMGPYTSEASTIVRMAGAVQTRVLTEAQYTAPSGVWITMTIIPSAGAPLGSSFDFDDGPIIPNEIFPILVDCDLFQDGMPYDMAFDSMYPSYNETMPAEPKDGWSHLFLVFSENTEFAPMGAPIPGEYELRCAIADMTMMNGWLVNVPFRVQ